MLAKELKKKYLKRSIRKQCGVMAIDLKLGYWWHVHDDEEIPEKYLIAIHER